MHLGIDLGTSGVKTVVTDHDGAVAAQATATLTVSNPQPLWSEQNSADWWRATQTAIAQLRVEISLEGIRGIGLSGQMHGAVLLDRSDRVLRPAILWNDGRSFAECAALDPLARRVAGNLAMPGFTAPKLLWVRAHEPQIFGAVARVLLPKDWLRLMMTGDALSDMSDAAGTLWLDVGARAWSPELLAATGLTEAQMPGLVEGTQPAGTLRTEIAEAWGLPHGCVVAGGAGDNAAGAAGIGCIAPGQAFVSLGTSGVIFVSDASFLPDPDRTVHAFCHCIPGTWHRMSVILSAAASLSWLARVTSSMEAALLGEVELAGAAARGRLVFLPYLSGERTPHNDPAAAGVFFGMTGDTTRADLARAVLEGVAFALADGLDALEARGNRIERLTRDRRRRSQPDLASDPGLRARPPARRGARRRSWPRARRGAARPHRGRRRHDRGGVRGTADRRGTQARCRSRRHPRPAPRAVSPALSRAARNLFGIGCRSIRMTGKFDHLSHIRLAGGLTTAGRRLLTYLHRRRAAGRCRTAASISPPLPRRRNRRLKRKRAASGGSRWKTCRIASFDPTAAAPRPACRSIDSPCHRSYAARPFSGRSQRCRCTPSSSPGRAASSSAWGAISPLRSAPPGTCSRKLTRR